MSNWSKFTDKVGGELAYTNLLVANTLSTSSALKVILDTKTPRSDVYSHLNHTENQISVWVHIYFVNIYFYTYIHIPPMYICVCAHSYVAYLHTCKYLYVYTHTENLYENMEQIDVNKCYVSAGCGLLTPHPKISCLKAQYIWLLKLQRLLWRSQNLRMVNLT